MNGNEDENQQGTDQGQNGDDQSQTGGTQSFTQADVDQIVSDRLNKERESMRTQLTADITAKLQESQSQAKKLEDMNQTQRAEYERDQANKEKADLQRQLNRISTEKTVTSMLADNGITATDDLLQVLVRDDMEAEDVKSGVEAFTQLVTGMVDKQVEEKVKQKMAGKTPELFGNGDSGNSLGASFAKQANESEKPIKNDFWS